MEVKWIKLLTGMFDDEKIKLIEAMPDADTILVIWVKLLTLAGKKNMNGYIFLAENIPYTDEMLSTLFNRPLNTIRLALDIFKKFKMVKFNNDGIAKITNWEKHQNIEGLDKIREQGRLRQKKHRKKYKELPEKPSNVTVTLHNETDKIRVDKNRIDKKEIKKDLSMYVEKWNEFLEPKVSTLTKDRKAKLNIRLREKDFVDSYDKILSIIKDTPFLRGDNNKNWRADFDWIITNDTNYVKILEGKYSKRVKNNIDDNLNKWMEENNNEENNI